MANDKREQAMQQLWERFMDEQSPLTTSHIEYERAFELGYDAGHAAATAEGIPQADGCDSPDGQATNPTLSAV